MRVSGSAKWLLATCLGLANLEFASAQDGCTAKESQPNPIAAQYPNSATGTINGTVSIIPIPYAMARSIVPKQYPILTKAYEKIMPQLGKGNYPLMLQIELDHDVQASGFHVPDFQRAALYYPFVDRLNDGYTNMAYSHFILLSNNSLAISGTAVYGYQIEVADFVPQCEAYVGLGKSGAIAQVAQSESSSARAAVEFSPVAKNLYTLDAYKNVTNQPTFSDSVTDTCDHYVRLYNTTVTQGKYAPVNIKGTVNVTPGVYPKSQTFTNVYGLKMDNAFIETNYVPCESLKGYTSSGPGD